MNKYKIIYRCSDGFEGEEIVYAVNSTMAFEVFSDFDFDDVISAECILIPEDEDEEETDDE